MRLKLFLFLVVLAAGLGAAGIWFWQQNSYSKDTLKLEIVAPDKVTMGEEITYRVTWKNNGDVRLEKASLIFEYPEGAIPSEGDRTRVTKALEDIYPGQEESVLFEARLFGKENEIKEAKATLSYTPKNLNATFRSETIATTEIALVPLNFELDIPSRMESGRQFDFVLNYFSNSEYPLSNLRIQIEYPSGFEFRRAFPLPIGQNEWNIGVLNQRDGERISITGVLEGSVGEVKRFKAMLGSWEQGQLTILKEVTKAVEITQSKLSIAQTVNSSAEYIASPADVLHYEVFFKNLGDRVLENLFLVLTLDGRAFDLDSIKVDRGKFQRGDNSIIWEARDVPKLRFLGRGEEGRVEFWVNVKEEIETFSPQDKDLMLRDRVLLSDAKQEFELKVNTRLLVEQRGFFQDEVFGNQGPLPPRVGSQTTYTVIWDVKNLYNDIKNVKVKTTLPPGTELTGKISPQDALLTFDSVSREIVWAVGDLPAGTGSFDSLPPSVVAFQIAFTPSDSQRGSKPHIIGEARVTGDDAFTEQVISSVAAPIDTALPDDDSVNDDKAVVQ